MNIKRKKYVKPACGSSYLIPGFSILANSVVEDSAMVSSVGQDIGVDESFDSDSFINGQWEAGGFGD